MNKIMKKNVMYTIQKAEILVYRKGETYATTAENNKREITLIRIEMVSGAKAKTGPQWVKASVIEHPLQG